MSRDEILHPATQGRVKLVTVFTSLVYEKKSGKTLQISPGIAHMRLHTCGDHAATRALRAHASIAPHRSSSAHSTPEVVCAVQPVSGGRYVPTVLSVLRHYLVGLIDY